MDSALRFLAALLQLAGMLVVLVAVLRLGASYLRVAPMRHPHSVHGARRRYVDSLLLAFEVLVGAGIVASVLHPSWSDIGKLAAIAALRTLIKLSLKYSARPET